MIETPTAPAAGKPSAPKKSVSNYIEVQRKRINEQLAISQADASDVIAEIAASFSNAEQGLQAFSLSYIKACTALQDQIRLNAWKDSRKPALSLLPLNAPDGKGIDQRVLAWFGVLLAFIATMFLMPSMFGTFNLFVASGAALFLYRRFYNKARSLHTVQSSHERIARVEQLKTLEPVLMQFSTKPSGNQSYPYDCTRVATGRFDSRDTSWNIDKTRYGDLLGASFITLIAGGEKREVGLLLQLPCGESPARFIEIKDGASKAIADIQALYMEQATAYAPALIDLLTPLVALTDHGRVKLKKIAVMKATLESLAIQEKSWEKVAVNQKALDAILQQIELFKGGSANAPKGILLYGPPGTGKTSIARNLAESSGCSFMQVNSADLKGQWQGHTAPKVVEMWDKARAKAPCIMFLDECEGMLASRRTSSHVDFDNELIEAFLAQWDGMNSSAGKVFVVGATNRRDGIDTAAVSRFSNLIEIGLPDLEARARILALEFKKSGIEMDVSDKMAKETAGMSGRDLNNLASRFQAATMLEEKSDALFIQTVRDVRGKTSTQTEIVSWEQVILPEKTKNKLQSLAKKIKRAEEYRQRGLPVPKSLLLFGPPGTGKTQIARALASDSGIAFRAVTTADIKGGSLGDSGRQIKQIFEQARSQAPCLLFIDEIDIVTGRRGGGDTYSQEVVGQLLQEMDGISSRDVTGQVFVLAATNCIDDIDSAVLSRFTEKEEIALPDPEARAAILTILLTGKPVNFEIGAVALKLAEQTAGFSGRDLAGLVNAAVSHAMERSDAEGLDIEDIQITEGDFSATARTAKAAA